MSATMTPSGEMTTGEATAEKTTASERATSQTTSEETKSRRTLPRIQHRIRIEGELRVEKALHVGGFGTSVNVDLPLAVNGQGQVYVPGTSLAGALRAWMRQNLSDPQLVRSLWGYQMTGDHDEGHASRITLEHAPVTLPANGSTEPMTEPMTLRHTEIRSGVGIDRHTGSAAEYCLYNRGVIPRGATLAFEMVVLLPAEDPKVREAIAQLLSALEQGEIRLGAAKTRGLGQVKLKNCTVREDQLGDRQGLLKFLEQQAEGSGGEGVAWKEWSQSAGWEAIAAPRLTFTLHWKTCGPLMVKSEEMGVAVDILPLMGSAGIAGESAFLLPGSAIKGALRSQGERIVRTMLTESEPNNAADTEAPAFQEQIKLQLIDRLFGLSADEKPTSDGNGQSEPPISYQGALMIEDCYSHFSFKTEKVQALARVPQDKLQQALADAELASEKSKGKIDVQQAFHVAIDRWTGGAADGFLYSTLEPFHVDWEPIELSVDLRRLKSDQKGLESEPLATVTLLLMLLRDLARGYIPLGWGTNRGFGALKLTKVECKVAGGSSNELASELGALNVSKVWKIRDGELDFSALNETLLSKLNEAWQQQWQLNKTEQEGAGNE